MSDSRKLINNNYTSNYSKEPDQRIREINQQILTNMRQAELDRFTKKTKQSSKSMTEEYFEGVKLD